MVPTVPAGTAVPPILIGSEETVRYLHEFRWEIKRANLSPVDIVEI